MIKVRGFLLISIMTISILVGGLLLSWFQQSIQQHYQSQAFLDSQILFQELNGAALLAVSHLRKQTPETLKSTFNISNTVFANDFENWAGSSRKNSHDLLLLLKSNKDFGEVQFQILLKNIDNQSADDYLKTDGVLILEN